MSAATATTTRMTTILIGTLIVTVTAADGGHVTDLMTGTTTDVVVKVAGPPPLPPIGRTGDLDLSHPAALPLRLPPDGEAAARGAAPPADIHHRDRGQTPLSHHLPHLSDHALTAPIVYAVRPRGQPSQVLQESSMTG